MGLISNYNLRSMIVRKGTAAMTAGGIAMVVAVFVMTLAIAQGFRGDAGRERIARERDRAAQGRHGRDHERGDAPGAADHRKPAAGGARRRRSSACVGRARRRSSRCRACRTASPANVPVRGVGPKAFDVRDTLKFVEGRRFTPGTREINVGRLAVGRFEGLTLGSDVKFGGTPLEGRRRLHRRRRGVRVGGLGRRRSDDAGVSAQRLSVGDRQAGRSLDVRFVRGGDRRRPASLPAAEARAGLLRGAVAGDDDRASACSARS